MGYRRVARMGVHAFRRNLLQEYVMYKIFPPSPFAVLIPAERDHAAQGATACSEDQPLRISADLPPGLPSLAAVVGPMAALGEFYAIRCWAQKY